MQMSHYCDCWLISSVSVFWGQRRKKGRMAHTETVLYLRLRPECWGITESWLASVMTQRCQLSCRHNIITPVIPTHSWGQDLTHLHHQHSITKTPRPQSEAQRHRHLMRPHWTLVTNIFLIFQTNISWFVRRLESGLTRELRRFLIPELRHW